jgi:hypothetical protein
VQRFTIWPAAAALALLVTSACADTGAGSPPRDGQEPTPTTDAAAWVSAEDYRPGLFDSDSAAVDHRWYPLRPGTRADYRGSSVEDGKRLHHGVTIIVTDLTKVIDGVRNVVVWERDYTEGQLVETELALFAQDRDGNIWHMGEYPEEWEDGEFAKAPAWIHGIAGATAGITIPAAPRVGTPDYAQGYAPPPISWVDRGRVHETGKRTCVPAGCYDDVVVIEEFERPIPNAFQDKFYAPEVGVVRVGWRGKNDESKEVLELVEFRRLSDQEMAEVRADALALERRAYRISEDVYGRTSRSEPTGS